MSERRSRRTRGERPELVPPKSDEEPDLDDNYVDENGNKIAVGAIRGRRRGKRGRSKDLSSVTPKGSSSSLSQQVVDKKQGSKKSSKPGAVAKKRGRRGRPPLNRSPSPSESSVSSSVSTSASIEEEDDDTMESGANPFESDASNDSNNADDENDDGGDDAERDTEDDAPKEALTGKNKKLPRKQKKKQQGQEEAHPRYKNPVKLECRHCGKLCFSQGIKIHELHCMPVYTPRPDAKKAAGKTKAKKQQQRRKRYERRGSSSDSRRSSSSISDSSDTSSPPSPVVIVRKKKSAATPKKSAVPQPLEKGSSSLVATDPAKPFICRNCGKFFTPRGINAHEKRCMPVYTERASLSPDIKQPKKENEQQPDSESKDQEHETSSSLEAENSDIEAPATKSKLRICEHCGKEVNTRGFHHHERSCIKKQRLKAKARNKKIALLEKDKGETKKRKRKISDKGAAGIATTTDDDSLWEDDASSAAKGKTANDATTNAGEGKIAEGKNTKNSKDPSSKLSLTVTPKKKRRKKKSDAKEDHEGEGSNVEMMTVNDDSSTSVGENLPKKKTKTPKLETAAEKSSKDSEQAKWSPDDSLPIASALASTAKTKKKLFMASSDKGSLTTSNKGYSGNGKDKTNLNAAQKKKATKNSKASKAATKGKTIPITEFFAPKTSGSKQQTKPAASIEVGEGKKSNEGDSTIAKEEVASTNTEKENSTGGTTATKATGKNIDEKEGSSNKIGEDEGQKSTKNIQDSVSKTAPATKKGGIVVVGEDEKVSSTTSTFESNKVGAAEIHDVAKEEPNSSKITRDDADMDEASVTPIDTEKSKREDDSAESDGITDSENLTDEGRTATRKGFEKKETNQTKVTVSTRPTRKRKLTPKAAEAAAIIATKNEEKRVDDIESDPVLGKKPKIIHGVDELVSDDPPSEGETSNEFTFNAKSATATPLKDQKGKATIVEAAKNAAAATLAAFSIFAAKSKSVEGTEKTEAETKPVESPPEANTVEKPTVNVATASNTVPKEQVQNGDEAPEEETETPRGDTKKAKPTEAVPTTTTYTRSLKKDDVVSSPEEVAPEAPNNDPDQTTHSSTTTDEPTTEEKQQSPPILNTVESPTAIHRGAPSEEINATKSTDQLITNAKTENERVEKTHLELDSKEAKSSTGIEPSVDVQTIETNTTKEHLLSLAISLEINKTQQNETAESASGVINDTAPLSKIDSISVRQDNSPITSDEVNGDMHTTDATDPEKTLSDGHTSNYEENRVEIQENTSATEDLTTGTNDSHGKNGIDQRNEKHGMEPQQSDAVEELAKEAETGKTGEGKSEEKDIIQSSQHILETENSGSANTGHPKTSVDQPNPQSLIVPKHDIVEKDNNKEVQKSKEVPTEDKETHGGSDEVRDETSAAVENKEPIVKGDEEIESDQVAGTDQSTVPKVETIGGISSEDLGDDRQDVEDTSKEIGKGDIEHSADDSAEAEDGIQGEKMQSKPNVAEKSLSAEGQNGEELSTKSQDTIGEPEEAVEENPAQSKSQIPSSTDLVESISDSMESENKSMAKAPENETRMSEDAVPTDRSPDLTKAAYVGQHLSLPADEPSLLQEISSTSTDAPKIVVISNNADIAVSKVAETNLAEQHPAESDKDASADTPQLSDVSKHGSLNDDISAANTSHSETPSQAEKSSKSLEEPKEDTDTLRAEITATPQRLENSIDWKETVSIQTKADIGSKDGASKTSEEVSTTTAVNTANGSDSNEVATNEGEDEQSKATDNDSDDQDTKSDVRNVAHTQEVVSNEKNAGVKSSGSITTAVENNDNVVDEANATITGNVATEFNDEKIDKSGISNTYEIDLQENERNTSAETSNQAENLGHNVSSVGVTGDDSIPSVETDSRSVEKNPPLLNSQQPNTSINAHNGSLQSDSGGQDSALKEADALSQVESVDDESNKIGEMVKVDSGAEKASSDVQSKAVDNYDDPECDKDEEAKANEQSQELPSGENNTVLPQTESKSSLETPAGDKMNLDTEKQHETSDAIIEGEKRDEGIYLISTEAPSVTDAEEPKAQMNLSQGGKKVVPIQSMELPTDDTKIDVTDAARKDVSVIVESLLNSVESRVNKSLKDVTHMDIDTSLGSRAEVDSAANTRMEVDAPDSLDDPKEDYFVSTARPSKETKSNDMQDMEKPITAISASEGNSVSEEPDSTMDVEVTTEEDVSDPKEEMKVSWVAMSKASRQSKPAKDTSRFIGYDENKTNRVKILLYTAGSQVHRGRGFERIFGMYWDAIGLRLSRPLNNNTSKRCDQAMSVFLKSKKLRKIHNKFVMSIMRRALKNRVPYSEVSEHVPVKWQDRVKVPHIVTSRKVPEKKNDAFYDGLKDDLLRISGVPHLDETTPYKERWELPIDEEDETQQNPQEGPTEPIASSCIPGALVVDPMLRETVEASGMKVTDNAMWLLTVALKEHIKNILNDSIEYKKGLKKGEIFPQAIHYPNVLACSSNKNRKISKGRTSAASLENGRKKRINSIDLFAALNMLPSGQPSSIGGSISRMSLEQTFLSGFNSIPSFYTGNAFKDVQSFISNTITVMAKDRKPEEKKVKSSQAKSSENQTSRSRQAKPTSRQEDNSKTPSPRHVTLPSSAKASESIATPMPSLESPPLTHNLSPAIVLTPVLDSSSPKKNVSQLASENQKVAATYKGSSAIASQGVDNEVSGAIEAEPTNVEKPVQTATAGVKPSLPGSQRSGAGRGAKNLSALMARASESSNNNQKESAQGGEKSDQTNTNTFSTANQNTSSTATVKPEINNRSNPEKPNTQGNTQESMQANPDPTKHTADSFKNGESFKPEPAAGAKNTEKPEGDPGNLRLPIPSRQPAAPVRRGKGKGKGFGSKDLAAMRARSMTTTTVESAAGDPKLTDKNSE